MKPQHFTILAVTAAAALLLAIVTYLAAAPSSTTAEHGGPLLPGLADKIGSVERIEVVRGPDTATLTKSGDQWLLAEKGGYPATAERVRALLGALTQAELIEPKTHNPERYALLDLGDPRAAMTSARLIRLLDGAGGVVAEVVAGKSRPDAYGSGKTGTYVRRPAEAQTWLANADLAAGTRLDDWTLARLFDVPGTKLTKLRISVPGEAPYDIKREGAGHVLAELPAGKKLKFVNVLDNIVEQASYIEFDNVRKVTGATGGEAGSAEVETENGLKLTYKLRREKDAVWLTLDVTGDGDAKQQAEDLKRRASGWEFSVLPSKADGLLRKLDDLLEASSS